MDTRKDLITSLLEDENDENGINKITEKIIGCGFKVMNELGCGFLEKVYENALAHEIKKIGLNVEQQKNIKVFYDGIAVGNYEPDLLVEQAVIVELKTVNNFDDVHIAQWLNYLKVTRLKICLLINFGNPRVQVRRVILLARFLILHLSLLI